MPLPFIFDAGSGGAIGILIDMAVLRWAKKLQELEDLERAKLEIVRRRYADAPTPESKAEYLRLLRQFADLVMRCPVPPPAEGQPHLSRSNVNDVQT